MYKNANVATEIHEVTDDPLSICFNPHNDNHCGTMVKKYCTVRRIIQMAVKLDSVAFC